MSYFMCTILGEKGRNKEEVGVSIYLKFLLCDFFAISKFWTEIMP